MRRRWVLAAAGVVAVAGAVTLGADRGGHPRVRPSAHSAPVSPSPQPSPSPSPVTLVPWHGPVEHIFFHTLVIKPRLAFTHDKLGQGFRDYFVTEREFRSIIQEMYDRGWTMVDLHQALGGHLEVPAGRKPFVLSEDDVNYYRYEAGHGLGQKLVLDAQGDVKVQWKDGPRTVVGDDDLVPIVDEFVAAHPLFSDQGAKGVLGVTGYDGVLGYQVERDGPSSVAQATAVADRLKATGWTFASHTYGHIDLTTDSIANITHDTRHWASVVEPILGHTDVLIYPFGAPARAGQAVLKAAGFTIQCDIDQVARVVRHDGITIMSRRHIDGIAFRDQVRNLAQFFDVRKVRDPLR